MPFLKAIPFDKYMRHAVSGLNIDTRKQKKQIRISWNNEQKNITELNVQNNFKKKKA